VDKSQHHNHANHTNNQQQPITNKYQIKPLIQISLCVCVVVVTCSIISSINCSCTRGM
jgi:hypothetical protein